MYRETRELNEAAALLLAIRRSKTASLPVAVAGMPRPPLRSLGSRNRASASVAAGRQRDEDQLCDGHNRDDEARSTLSRARATKSLESARLVKQSVPAAEREEAIVYFYGTLPITHFLRMALRPSTSP